MINSFKFLDYLLIFTDFAIQSNLLNNKIIIDLLTDVNNNNANVVNVMPPGKKKRRRKKRNLRIEPLFVAFH